MVRSNCPALSSGAARIWVAILALCVGASVVSAKAPGKSHCYRSVCVKVLTVAEVKELLGKTVRMTASHYGDPSVDPFNRGTFTSNGEKFSADDPTRTASATFPDGTELLLRNPATGGVSHVRVNDFGPFWVNRELDVTERVARNLGFEKQGIKTLEVTVVSLPTADDVKRLYRRDRPQVPAMGFLGKRSQAETAKLAQVLMRRDPGIAPHQHQQTIAAGATQPAVHTDRIVVREHVYHFVPQIRPSPRALGAEELTAADIAAGTAALAQWSERRQASVQFHNFSFAVFGSFLMLALMAPYGAPLLLSGARSTHRFLTYDDAIEHLRLVLAQDDRKILPRLSHGQLLQLPAPDAVPLGDDMEADVTIVKPDGDASAVISRVEEATLPLQREGKRLPSLLMDGVRNRPLYLRFDQLGSAVLKKRQMLNWSNGDNEKYLVAPKKVARIVGEGVRHDGDLSSSDLIIISGHVVGDVRSPQVAIEPTGCVDGDVFADTVRIEGRVHGNVAAQKVELEATAFVSGDVEAKIINAARGALIEGRNVELPLTRNTRFVEGQRRGRHGDLQLASVRTDWDLPAGR